MSPTTMRMALHASAIVQKLKASSSPSPALHLLPALQRLGLAKAPSAPTASYPFLRLPPKVRIMCYEFFIVSLALKSDPQFLRPHDLPGPGDFWPATSATHSCISLYRKCIPLDLLYTCRLIYTEAFPIFAPLLHKLATEPLRFTASSHAAAIALACAPSPVVTCLGAKPENPGLIRKVKKSGRAFIALAARPRPRNTVGDVDVEITILPTTAVESIQGLEQALGGIAACAARGSLRFRIIMCSQGAPVRIAAAIEDVVERVEVRNLGLVEFTKRFWRGHDLMMRGYERVGG